MWAESRHLDSYDHSTDFQLLEILRMGLVCDSEEQGIFSLVSIASEG